MRQNTNKTKKIVLSAMLIAIGIVGSTLFIPFMGGKIFFMQHFLNVIGAVLLGPMYAVINAFCISLIRNIMGTGSLLAFPGSMIGAFLSAIVYKRINKYYGAVIGEIIGTGIIGAILCYPIASLLLGKEAAIFTYIMPFLLSSISGSILALIVLKVPIFEKVIKKQKIEIESN